MQPALRKVLADAINLPRDGRFIEQLTAIEDATQRTTAVKAVATGLLALPQAHLHATAEALFDAYRKPRALASLRELMAASADAGKVAAAVAAVDDALGDDKLLPVDPELAEATDPGLGVDVGPPARPACRPTPARPPPRGFRP